MRDKLQSILFIFILITLGVNLLGCKKDNPVIPVQTSWLQQSSQDTKFLRSVYFIDTVNGWAAGLTKNGNQTTSGSLLWTSNGGNNWFSNTVQSSDYLTDVYFLNNSVGFVSGSYNNAGILYKTIDGGMGWALLMNTNNIGLYEAEIDKIYVLDQNSFYVMGLDKVAYEGFLFKTTNGGSNWQRSGIFSSYDLLYGICFTDMNTGWLCGSSGKTWKTTNGGLNWTFNMAGYNRDFKYIHFADANTGCLIGVAGTICKSTNGGINWYLTNSNTTQDLNNGYFVNGNTGWAVAAKTIIKTIDGGETWNIQTINVTIFELNSVYFINPLTGWVVGGDYGAGFIFKTTTGGL